jgi:hypothetical protein
MLLLRLLSEWATHWFKEFLSKAIIVKHMKDLTLKSFMGFLVYNRMGEQMLVGLCSVTFSTIPI